VDLYIGPKPHGYTNPQRTLGVRCVAHAPVRADLVCQRIATFGGKHVDYILGQITRKMAAFIEKKKKINVNQNTIKEQLILFLRCDIENPAFNSQTKDYMNTPSSGFGSTCSVSDSL
jgi:DNA gyrase/topoisomerase IV subunit B